MTTPLQTPLIYLLGLRASGKSTIGPLLAEALGRRFIDLDDDTLQQCNAASGMEVFARPEGDAAWRAAEAVPLVLVQVVLLSLQVFLILVG